MLLVIKGQGLSFQALKTAHWKSSILVYILCDILPETTRWYNMYVLQLTCWSAVTYEERLFKSKRRYTENWHKYPVHSQFQLRPCSANVFCSIQLNNFVTLFELVFVRMQGVQKKFYPHTKDRINISGPRWIVVSCIVHLFGVQLDLKVVFFALPRIVATCFG